MREIKFRAWDKTNSKWLDSNCGQFLINQNGELVFHQEGNNPLEEVKDVIKYYVMQYTGLKDKNGKEIYEGDILLRDGGFQLIVSYKNGAYTRSYQNSNIYLLYDAFITDGCLVDYMAIGNIYENPELLEDESNDK